MYSHLPIAFIMQLITLVNHLNCGFIWSGGEGIGEQRAGERSLWDGREGMGGE